jgi:RNA polymerase sporulation-specific sigma factor
MDNVEEKIINGIKISEHIAMVHHILINRFGYNQVDTPDYDEYVAVGLVGLNKAARYFKPEKGFAFMTFAHRVIENDVLMHLRRMKKFKREISLHTPINYDGDGNALEIVDVLGCSEYGYEAIDAKEELKYILDHRYELFNKSENRLLDYILSLGEDFDQVTQKEMQGALGISQSYIARMLAKIRSKTQKFLKKEAI